MGNTFGHTFRITTWGESHGGGVGVVVDGCPPRLELSETDLQTELDRRRPGQSKIVTQRKESDTAHILSGVFEGRTLGTPISILVWNEDAKPEAYEDFKDKYRPSHADYTFEKKYGIRDHHWGGRASARETIGRVAGGAVAKKILAEQCGVAIAGYVRRIQNISAEVDPSTVRMQQVESNIVRCPDARAAEQMIDLIAQMRKQGDSVGGIIECVARGVPAGLGAPVFDKLEADLAKGVMSIPATKGFEIGSGFAGTEMTGSQHNDPFQARCGKVRTRTNHSGGIQGGISNGEDIVLRVAFKPTATIMMEQDTVDVHGKNVKLKARGRHDPCVLPRAVPIVEAMVALVLVDHYLRQKTVALND